MSKTQSHAIIKKLTVSAMLTAVGLLLPFLTAQIPQIGQMLLPMHIPVLLCGLLCGWQYGLGVGLIVPVLRSLCFGMPPIFPTATAMAFELAAYGFAAGFIYMMFRRKTLAAIYISLVSAMIIGRVVWGAAMYFILMSGSGFTFEAFVTGAFVNAFPGIILQLATIPILVKALEKAGLRR